MIRIEWDSLGELSIPKDAYYGIHALRAKENFSVTGQPPHRELIWAMAVVKKACTVANREIGMIEAAKAEAIIKACDELAAGSLDGQIIVDALSGGAGTSMNMNINEVIANRALEFMGFEKGRYNIIHPLEDVNLNQSTNDVFPTAVKVATVRLLRELADEVALLQGEFQKKEKEYAKILKVGRTELQDAVPVTVGQEFSAWAEALNRDWWRLNKAVERVRQVNLGGTAVGTGLNCPKIFIDMAVEKLRELTGLPVAKADNLFEATQNTDTLLEVLGYLKTLSSNLIKIASDLRFLSSGPKAGIGELKLPAVQVGSSIMPGKVNPVIPEMVTQVGIKVIASDHAVGFACSMGNLELNPFLPLIAHELIGSLKMLKSCVRLFREKCISGITVDEARCRELFDRSSCIITAFSPYLGYETCAEIYKEAVRTGRKVEEILIERGFFTEEEIESITQPQELTTPGFAGIKYLRRLLK
ncbi:aspartate ammonia-lyase [Thermodesulfovibrio yellowstonii]|uniref:Aspartate ammonia-lyase n=1 Tax=Thermodesulfovibrio yellowstonii TaxID=28262 RepID=A0A9W6LKK1_9BACT|nr:aspartate ammonia-lyase [Thermodesulfovibrio islandicus]GLI52910.1 aspartate ammonia-lyase [Thermodesulfovibrio islandicus]